VELPEDDTVVFTITAFSRRAAALARLAAPVGSSIQRWITRRYLRALWGPVG
jgi:uncharacterized protein (UPF0548 family)